MSPRLWSALAMGVALALASAPAAAAPARNPVITNANATGEGEAPAAPTGPVVDLNRAGVDELCTLPGIGRKKAEAIIALRDRRPFTRVTQLLQIKGIGHKTLLKLKPRVTVTPAPSTAPVTSVASAAVAATVAATNTAHTAPGPRL